MSNNIRSPHLSISPTIEVTIFTDKAVILVDVHYPLTYTSLNVSKWFVPRASDTVYCAISEGSKLLVITCTSRTWNNIHTRFCGHSRTSKLKVTTAQAYKVSYGSFARIIFTPVRQSTIIFLKLDFNSLCCWHSMFCLAGQNYFSKFYPVLTFPNYLHTASRNTKIYQHHKCL